MYNWFIDIEVARFLGVPVWELDEHPIWKLRGRIALNVHNELKDATSERVM